MVGDFSWDDTPGSQLPSREEAIGLTAARRITEVRAVYDEEYAYRTVDGVGSFQPGFTGSTMSEDGKVVSLRRSGGWNRRMRVYPEIEASAGINPGWDLLYDVDWSMYPTADILWYSGGPGQDPYVSPVDGHVWHVVARYNNNGDYSIRTVHGEGLRLTGGGSSFPGQPGSQPTLVHKDFSSLPGYAGRAMAVIAEFAYTVGAMGDNGSQCGVQMHNWATYVANQQTRGADASLFNYGNSIRRCARNNIPPAGDSGEGPVSMTFPQPGHVALAIQQAGGRATGLITAPTWPGHFPAFSEMRGFVEGANGSLNDAQFAAECTGGGVYAGGGGNGSPNPVTIKRIQFWQRQP